MYDAFFNIIYGVSYNLIKFEFKINLDVEKQKKILCKLDQLK
jgi:hypothetical protein